MKGLLRNVVTTFLTKEKLVQAIILEYDRILDVLVAQVGNQRAYIAREEITLYSDQLEKEIHRLLGAVCTCKVLGIDNTGNLILSRKAYMQQRFDNNYAKGDVVDGIVTSADKNALYITFDDGLTGKIYLNQLTSSQLSKPLDIFNIGDTVKCAVLHKKEGKYMLDLSRINVYKDISFNIQLGQTYQFRITQKVNEYPGFFAECVNCPTISGVLNYRSLKEYSELKTLENYEELLIADKKRRRYQYKIGEVVELRVVEVVNDKKLRLIPA